MAKPIDHESGPMVAGFRGEAVGLVSAILLLLAGCATTSPQASNDPDGTQLTIVAQEITGPTNAVYIEGSLRFVRVAGDVTHSVAWQTPMGKPKTIGVKPGRYMVTAWERVCGGNCDNLDQITNRCSLLVDVPEHGSVRVVIRWTVPNPCVMAIG
jgi:hypothetical protein